MAPHLGPSQGLQGLPKEVLSKILRIVQAHTDDIFFFEDREATPKGLTVYEGSVLLPMRTVCRDWRGAVDDAIRYFTYDFSARSLSPSEVAQQTLWWGFVLHSVLPRWQHLATLKLAFDWPASYLRFVLQSLRQGCPALETLSLQADPKEEKEEDPLRSPTDDPRIAVLAPLRSLSSLTAVNFKVFAPLWVTGLSSLTSLKDLRLESGGFDNLEVPPGLTQLHVEHSPRGDELQLEMESATALLGLTLQSAFLWQLAVPPTLHALQLSFVKIDARRLNPLPALTSLQISATDVDDLSWLSDCSELRLLKLEYAAGVTPLPDLSHMTKLTKLYLRDLVQFHNLPPLHCLPSLTVLKVGGCPLLQSLPRLPPALRTLLLRDWPRLSSMEELLSAPSLTTLNMEDCPELSLLPDLSPLEHVRTITLTCVGLSSLQGLGMLGNSLQTLRMEDLPALSTLDSLSTLHSLGELQIKRCQQLEQVGPLPLPELATLDLDSCANVKKVSFSGFTNIIWIRVHECGATVLEGLLELPRLKTVLVSECVNITTVAFGPGLSKLRKLDLVDCPGLKSLVGVSYLPKFAKISTVIMGQALLQVLAGEEVVTPVHGDDSDRWDCSSGDEEDNWG